MFAVACYRRARDNPSESAPDRAVCVAELFADGLLPYSTLRAAGLAVMLDLGVNEWCGSRKVAALVLAQRSFCRERAALLLQVADGGRGGDSRFQLATGAEALRCIFGNPFRPLTISPSWLTSTVTSLARGMYDSRDFSAMPILADALQDSGCSDEAILAHCRGNSPHCRGCHVTDAILAKS